MKIKQQYVASRSKTFPGVNGRKYITIHETANEASGANAQAHANLQSNGFSASWHWQVDDQEAIQSYPNTVRCWHAGDGASVGNLNSIGIEICVNRDGDYEKAVKNTATLVRQLMTEYSIPLENIVQHHRWSGKNCPKNLRSGAKGVNWQQFIRMIEGQDHQEPDKGKEEPKNYTSIVAYLNDQKIDSSFSHRAKLAVQYGIPNYKGTASQNTLLLSKLLADKNQEKLVVDGYLGPLTIRALQRYFGTTIDGVISKPSEVIRALQKLLAVTQDGYLGPMTIRALQQRFGTVQDGVLSKPSAVIQELQRRLNNGRL